MPVLTSSIKSPLTLKTELPLKEETLLQIQSYRKTIENLLAGLDNRLAFIIGPCSLHDTKSAITYAEKVKDLQKKVEDTCFLVMRAYIEKPRTCLGWKGLLYDPLLQGEDDLPQGLVTSRKLLLALAELQVPLATEFLDPLASLYFADLISWGFIGARTSASQIHRQLASSLPLPIGFKNSIDGSIKQAVHGVIVSQKKHTFLHMDEEGKMILVNSPGNPFCHIVLRGSETKPNYSPSYIEKAQELCLQNGLTNRLLVDCSHGNCQKNALKQAIPLLSLVEQYLQGNKNILGGMIESHLNAGSQPFPACDVDPALSITDPCIGWQETEDLLCQIHECLRKKKDR